MRLLGWILFLPVLALGQWQTFILCEGNFGSANASLWMLDEHFQNATGPIYWDPSNPANPLGDVGQSMIIEQDRLFIVMNNSHTVEVMRLNPTPSYERTLAVPGCSPRDLEISNGIGYLSCWGLQGILVINLDTYEFQDTLRIDGLPEDLIAQNGYLYVSIPLTRNWQTDQRVLKIALDGEFYPVVETYSVVPGPEKMLLHDNQLFIASTYYDASWNSYAGMSRINLSSGEITCQDYGMANSYGADLAIYRNQIYRTYAGTIAPLKADLTLDLNKSIGNFSWVYAMDSFQDYLFFGLSDYIAPDEIVVLDPTGKQIARHLVGAIPGTFVFYPIKQANISDQDRTILPDKNQLFQNFPNPFNQKTTIPFYLKQESQVIVNIYNLKGELVQTLIDGLLSAGTHRVYWNGKDKDNIPSPLGVYYYQLITGSKRQSALTQKMLYLK